MSLYVILETKPTIASVRDTAITSLKVDTNTLERRNLVVSKINIKSAFFWCLMSRLGYAVDNLSNIVMNGGALRSWVFDADYAREISELARTQTI